jgi:hypothetical protein
MQATASILDRIAMRGIETGIWAASLLSSDVHLANPMRLGFLLESFQFVRKFPGDSHAQF